MALDTPAELIGQSPELERFVARYLGSAFQHRLLHRGLFSTCWWLSNTDGHQCVLRYRPSEPVGVETATEEAVLKLLKDHPLAPETLFYNPPFWLYPYVAGEQYDSMHIRQPQLLKRIGAAVAKLHQIEAPALPALQLADNLAALEQMLPKLPPSLQRLGEKAHQALEYMQVGDHLCHHDLWAENLIFTANKSIVMLDWEYARRGDALFDLANFIQHHSLIDEQITTLLAAAGYSHVPKRLLPLRHLSEYLRCLWYEAYPHGGNSSF